MRTQLNPLMMLNKFERLFIDPDETQTLTLSPGRYLFALRGAGGSGGQSSSYSGGAGAPGKLATQTILFTKPTTVAIHVGDRGRTYADGGNGGAPGTSGQWGGSYMSGAGGGGGKPTYIIITESDETPFTIYALGGGGGGGGGATTPGGRYARGAGGGAGGGYYRFNVETNTIESVPGMPGAHGADGRSYVNGDSGINGNITDFPNLRSGGGGPGSRTGGGAGASGGGASGAGGGEGGNHTSGFGGAGGGGARGDDVAGGGAGAGNASNYYTTPISVSAENESVGVSNNYGIGGAPNANGNVGFVLVRRVSWN